MTLVEIVGNLYVRCEMLQQEVERLQAEGAQLAAAVTTLQSEATAARVAEVVLRAEANLEAICEGEPGNIRELKLNELIHAELNKPLAPPVDDPTGGDPKAQAFLADVNSKLAEGQPVEAR